MRLDMVMKVEISIRTGTKMNEKHTKGLINALKLVSVRICFV